MDYCYQCRRNLNGALVCPGCGAYAPDIAPPDHTRPAAAVSSYAEFAGYPAHPEYTDFAHPREQERPALIADPPAAEPDPEELPEPVATLPRGGGRAARRQAQARWRKNRRKAVAATAVALAGGGLTIAAMPNGGSGDRSTAAEAPDTPVGDVLPGATSPATAPANAAAPAAAAPQRHPGRPAPPHPAATAAPGGTVSVPVVPRTAAPQQVAARAQADQPVTAAPTAAPESTATPAPQPTTSAPPPAATQPTTPPPATQPTQPPHELCLLVVCL